MKRQIDCPQYKAKKALKQRCDFPFDKRIETTNTLPTIESQKILKTTVRFSI